MASWIAFFHETSEACFSEDTLLKLKRDLQRHRKSGTAVFTRKICGADNGKAHRAAQKILTFFVLEAYSYPGNWDE
ncbi:hypothetical protein [Desulfococcus sp.]|uniref:hypothetical protein n=1 Tax=Desulfococcus sp. TaxID=2025834 RepID=UPI003594011D